MSPAAVAASSEVEPIRRITPDPAAARDLLDDPAVEAVELPQTPLEETPYRDLVQALVGVQSFTLDFKESSPQAALAMLCERLLGPGAYVPEREALAREVSSLAAFAQGLAGARQVMVSLRNWFAPGDLVWHVDRSQQRRAFRLLWPLGRPAGMKVTPADNIDETLHRAFMSREYPLLYQLDRRVSRTPGLSGAQLESLWAHRPAQVAAMTSGRFPFVKEPGRERAIRRDAPSVHRIETPHQKGTLHRSSWENRSAPGLQFVITAGAA